MEKIPSAGMKDHLLASNRTKSLHCGWKLGWGDKIVMTAPYQSTPSLLISYSVWKSGQDPWRFYSTNASKQN